ncbi:MAG: thioredoxin family protein [Nanoarchaeota archaeon]|nr:thioredoxin family protein [Nanoarchaeota archaeon]
MKRRRADINKYLASFAIATLIFILGITLGHYFSSQKLDRIDELASELQLNTMGTELQFLLISERPCDFLNSSEMTEELYQIGARLDFMESEMGQTNTQVLGLKEYYHMLEIRHWLFLKKSREQCSQDYDLILYFYSNKGDCPRCQDQGNVLTYLHRKYPRLNIYSFDINIDNPALRTIRSLYAVEGEPPILVIDDETHIGFMTSSEIEEKLTGDNS